MSGSNRKESPTLKQWVALVSQDLLTKQAHNNKVLAWKKMWILKAHEYPVIRDKQIVNSSFPDRNFGLGILYWM